MTEQEKQDKVERLIMTGEKVNLSLVGQILQVDKHLIASKTGTVLVCKHGVYPADVDWISNYASLETPIDIELDHLNGCLCFFMSNSPTSFFTNTSWVFEVVSIYVSTSQNGLMMRVNYQHTKKNIENMRSIMKTQHK